MATSIFLNPVGGLSPLGQIAVPAPNTSVLLNSNVGPQSQSATKGRTNRFRQLIISTDPTNTQNIYLVWKGYNKTNLDYILDKIPPGTVRSYPPGALLEHSSLNVDNFAIDADVAGESCYASVLYG
jgi:hypothetical protein